MKKKKIYFFLDRDGTIIKHINYLRRINDIKIYKNIFQSLKILKQFGEIYVITNQSAVARGLLSEKKLKKINNFILNKINKREKYIKKIFYCPHHKEGKLLKYKRNCIYRKPGIGFIKRFKNIDKNNSWFIGDTYVDVETAKNSGIKSVLLLTGKKNKKNANKIKPDIISKNILFASKKIKQCLLKL